MCWPSWASAGEMCSILPRAGIIANGMLHLFVEKKLSQTRNTSVPSVPWDSLIGQLNSVQVSAQLASVFGDASA